MRFRNLRSLPTRLALAILRRAFRRDPDFAHSWFCNIAMPIHDCGVPIATANEAGHRLMQHLFSTNTRNIHP